jgi:alkaline phosphatase D
MTHDGTPGLDRRTFLKASGGGALGFALPGIAAEGAHGRTADPQAVSATTTARRWLGPAYWANRLQDWRSSLGRIECVALPKRKGLRTVGVLSREILAGDLPAQLTVRTGTLVGGAGFSGFLIGVGSGALDYRAAALAQGASGTGGGILCTYESGGAVGFREHSDEENQLVYAALPVSSSNAGPARTTAEDVELRLAITPLGDGRHDVTLAAVTASTGAPLAQATLSGVADASLVGGVMLVSAPQFGSAARHWFSSLVTSGAKVGLHDERGVGPILGTLFTVAGRTFKCTAQFMPIGAGDPQSATLEFRRFGATSWERGPTSAIGRGFAAQFRVENWLSTSDYEYRIVYGMGTPLAQTYVGQVPREPGPGTPLVLAVLNCTIHSYRSLAGGSAGSTNLPGGHYLGLYTRQSLYFPYAETAGNLAKLDPDLIVALGDQFYENQPSMKDPAAPLLDSLYKYYLWLWSFRDLTSRIPCVVLVDDHDMYQGNLWGHSGDPAPNGDYNQGGYVQTASWVNAMQAIQCGHNPDAFDPTPVNQGISVYYCTFTYGGVSFAVLEDRKFKTGDADGRDASGHPFLPSDLHLLGPRQEQLLTAWAVADVGLPKVCLTQTMLACLQTDADGQPMMDNDSNGYPPNGRNRAVQLLKAASALVLCGDQHLGAVVRHGTTTFTDGPIQFMSPALGAGYIRWFEPAAVLANDSGLPNTGDFIDGFGNRLRVLAVANPVVSRATYAAQYGRTRQGLGDRALKREGFGVVRVDRTRGQFTLECWPWDVDPTGPASQQYPGWPLTVPFDAL